MNDTQLIEGCKRGNRQAQKTLFDAYSKGMLLLCRRYVRDHNDAEEVLLTGFHKFFLSIDRFEYSGTGSVGGWVKKILINECLLFLRKSREITFSPEEYTEAVVSEDDIVAKMNAADILKLISKLPDGYRLVFNLYVIEGYNHREIAEMLEITEGTSKSQLSKARALLQKQLKKNELVYEQQ